MQKPLHFYEEALLFKVRMLRYAVVPTAMPGPMIFQLAGLPPAALFCKLVRGLPS